MDLGAKILLLIPAIATILAAFASQVSQLSLAPIYGSIPSSINHRPGITVAFLLGFLLRSIFQPPGKYGGLEAAMIITGCIPAIQMLLFTYTEELGPVLGPLLSELATCHAVIVAAAYTVAEYMELTGMHARVGRTQANAIIGVSSLFPFLVLEAVASAWVPWLAAYSPHLRPVSMQLITAGAYATLAMPSQIMLNVLAVVAFASGIFGPHGTGFYAHQAFNNSLAKLDWEPLARGYGNTGYLSVLEGKEQQYRVLRCDHSILGGEWLLTDERRAEGWKTTESIYAAFTMLEAVRLVETESQVTDDMATALVIGLGVGTAPKALLQHGIDTTIVEIDAMVHEYALQYFGLPPNHTAVLLDAVTWVGDRAANTIESRKRSPPPPSRRVEGTTVEKYDYIIHDVFTGGAEPLALFTSSFLQDLRALLTPHGVAAINYAGDLDLPLTRTILNTIDLAFGRQCKIFRDSPVPDQTNSADADTDETFANMIVFCRNSPGPINFRKPTSDDFLGSQSRRAYLYPRANQEIQFPLRGEAGTDAQVLYSKRIASWQGEQEQSAIRHWQIMRKVLPARVWELY